MVDVNLVKLLNNPVQLVFTGGITPTGAYDNGNAYATGESVSYNGSSYVAIQATTGNLPTNTTYWQLLASIGNTGSTGAQGDPGEGVPTGGSTGQLLRKVSATDYDSEWATVGALTDGDKGDITVSSSGTVWNIDAGVVGVTELSATGTPSSSTYLRGDNTWATVAGLSDGDKGDITVSGSGATWTIDNGVVSLAKMADMATDSFLGRDTAGTGAPEVLSVATARTLLGLGSAAYVATDLADLNEATIESAIDTLANLTSIQGRTVTLADAGADAVFGWDDSANAYVNLTAADARTALGLIAGGTGDIWVEKAGDTMTGPLVMTVGTSTGTTSLDITGTQTATSSGSTVFTNFTQTIAPASNSSNTFRSLNMSNTPNAASGVTISQINGARIEGASLGATNDGTITTVIGADVYGILTRSTSVAAGSVTEAIGIRAYGNSRPSGTSTVTGSTIAGGWFYPTSSSGLTFTNQYGIRIEPGTAGNTITNAYGADIQGQTRGSTSNIGLRVGLSSGATTNAAIQLSDTTGVVGGGLLFGTETTLHRSAANVLTLNGDLVVSDEAYGVGWNGSLEVPTKNAIYDKIEAIPALTDGDKGDITVSGSGTVWSIDAATIGLTELSATGTPSASTYLRGDNTWATIAGGGDVTKVGTPSNNQMAVWTGDGTLEGTSDFTYDGTNLNLITGKNFQIAGGTVLADSAGTLTLSGIDALDATTEATIEAAIDTLANLTSIQGRTVTLADAGANAIFGWDDVAGAYENLSQAEARAVLGLGTAAYVATDLADLNEATIEAAIDTLANLTSVQGLTVTLADAGANAIFGWDDTAGAYENLTQAEVRTIIGNTSDTNVGLVELATIAETNTGTDATRAVTPDGLAGSVFGERGFSISSFPAGTNVAVGDGTTAFVVPAFMNGMNLVAAVAGVHTAGTTGTMDIQIRRRRSTTNADMLTVKLTIDSTEADSTTAATGITIDSANDDIQTGDKIYIDVDAVHTTPAQGLSTTLTFRLP